MIVEFHVSPNPPGDATKYEHVEAAIAVVQNSELTSEVGALGTTFEGSPDEVWALLRKAHEATLASGAQSCITEVRIFQRNGDDSPLMSTLVAPFR